MLKSLYAGVSGLQSHQIAMDIESNNIANVNTVGFKYSRANFSDLLAQTKSIATAPQGALGGKNAVQIGLGSTVSSMTRIFSQGSVQSSDKNTDVAIQGDGFFVVSPDAGNTYKYTRAGDFKFDAAGNFVDNNGFIAQGWLRDENTRSVDSTAPITNINIAPGLTTPANPTQEVVLKANLNSGSLIQSYSSAYNVPSGVPNGITNPGEDDALDDNGRAVPSGDVGVMFNEVGEGFSLQKDQGIWASFIASELDGAANVTAASALDIQFDLDDTTDPNHPVVIQDAGGGTAIENANSFVSKINALTSITGVTASVNLSTGSPRIDLSNSNGNASTSHNIRISDNSGGVADNGGIDTTSFIETAYRYQYDPSSRAFGTDADKKFTTMSDLRYALEQQAQSIDVDGDGTPESNIKIIVNKQGKFEISNLGGADDDYTINLKITGISNSSTVDNVRFTRNMEALNSTLPVGTAQAFSQSFNAATHSSSIDIFDSLGSKHTLRSEFRKVAVDVAGSSWNMLISVPQPAEINTQYPQWERKGSVRFTNEGAMSTYNPPSISFTGNNGSAPNQQVSLSFGTANTFDGMTSFDSQSTTSGISQDGYTGGDLIGIRIDQSGTLVGSFSNGRSFGLAQIGMAKFTNNEGLTTEGGNIFIQTANSGDPIIGTAATAGRGFIQSSALEASNVDLSRALTQLIIIQRGYQANGKTITTSDQLLETLIGLKR